MKEIDARGRPCPQPVLMTKKAVDSGETEITVIVDNEGSAQNVKRFGEKQGFTVSVEKVGTDFRVVLSKDLKVSSGEGVSEGVVTAETEIQCETGTWRINNGQVILLSSDKFGRGNDELGEILAESLLNTLADNDAVPGKMVLINAGVKLVCSGSKVIEALKKLESKGVEILACGTCLNFYGLTERLEAGRVSNAFEILNTLLEAERLVSF